MSGHRREPCETCTLLTELHPGRSVSLGRQRSDGRFFCETHWPKPQPTPDPQLTLEGLRQTGLLRAFQDTARSLLAMHVAPSVLRDALEHVAGEPVEA